MPNRRLVTGVFRTPDGTIFANKSLTWFRNPRATVAQGGAVIVDEPFVVQTNGAGEMSREIEPGSYLVMVRLKDVDRYFDFGLPEGDGAYNAADGIAAGQPVLTPDLVLQTQQLRDQALQAAGDAQLAALAVASAVIETDVPLRLALAGATAEMQDAAIVWARQARSTGLWSKLTGAWFTSLGNAAGRVNLRDLEATPLEDRGRVDFVLGSCAAPPLSGSRPDDFREHGWHAGTGLMLSELDATDLHVSAWLVENGAMVDVEGNLRLMRETARSTSAGLEGNETNEFFRIYPLLGTESGDGLAVYPMTRRQRPAVQMGQSALQVLGAEFVTDQHIGHHVWMRSGTELRYYRNGVLRATETVANGAALPEEELLLWRAGALTGTAPLAHVTVGQALSDAEVQWLYRETRDALEQIGSVRPEVDPVRFQRRFSNFPKTQIRPALDINFCTGEGVGNVTYTRSGTMQVMSARGRMENVAPNVIPIRHDAITREVLGAQITPSFTNECPDSENFGSAHFSVNGIGEREEITRLGLFPGKTMWRLRPDDTTDEHSISGEYSASGQHMGVQIWVQSQNALPVYRQKFAIRITRRDGSQVLAVYFPALGAVRGFSSALSKIASTAAGYGDIVELSLQCDLGAGETTPRVELLWVPPGYDMDAVDPPNLVYQVGDTEGELDAAVVNLAQWQVVIKSHPHMGRYPALLSEGGAAAAGAPSMYVDASHLDFSRAFLVAVDFSQKFPGESAAPVVIATEDGNDESEVMVLRQVLTAGQYNITCRVNNSQFTTIVPAEGRAPGNHFRAYVGRGTNRRNTRRFYRASNARNPNDPNQRDDVDFTTTADDRMPGKIWIGINPLNGNVNSAITVRRIQIFNDLPSKSDLDLLIGDRPGAGGPWLRHAPIARPERLLDARDRETGVSRAMVPGLLSRVADYLGSRFNGNDSANPIDSNEFCAAGAAFWLFRHGIEAGVDRWAQSFLRLPRIDTPVPGCIVLIRRNVPVSEDVPEDGIFERVGHVTFFVRQEGDQVVTWGFNQGATGRVGYTTYNAADIGSYRLPTEGDILPAA